MQKRLPLEFQVIFCSVYLFWFLSAVVGLGADELVEAVEAGAAARLEDQAQHLHHGRVGNVI